MRRLRVNKLLVLYTLLVFLGDVQRRFLSDD